MLPLELRLAVPEDVAAVVQLVESAYRGESSRAGWTTEADLLDGRRTDADAVGAIVAGGSDGRAALLVAEAALDAVGSDDQAATLAEEATAEPGGAPKREIVACCVVEGAGAGAAYFGMFAVRPELQGGGIGRQMVHAAERHARRRLGASTMRMHVLRQRGELIAWYRRLGYEPTGETAPFHYGDERFGLPRRDDLEFVVLARSLAGDAAAG
jgi:ribosomal protein S18 acetylase RimI-like enzyme